MRTYQCNAIYIDACPAPEACFVFFRKSRITKPNAGYKIQNKADASGHETINAMETTHL